MSTKLQDYLSQIQDLQKKIQAELDNQTTKTRIKNGSRTKLFPSQEALQENDEFYPLLPHHDEPYYMLTLTFHPEVAYTLDEYGQCQRLKDSLAILNQYRYYSCLEKHKSGVVHAHALIICDHHDIQEDLHKIKKKITTSSKLHPAINIKAVKKSKIDVDRSYQYIVHDKDDHPIFKKLIYNI